jgi:hypothetical protein
MGAACGTLGKEVKFVQGFGAEIGRKQTAWNA